MVTTRGICWGLLGMLLLCGCQTAAAPRRPAATASTKTKGWNDQPLASQQSSPSIPSPVFPTGSKTTSAPTPAPFGTANPSNPFPAGQAAPLSSTTAPTAPFAPSGATQPVSASQPLVMPPPATTPFTTPPTTANRNPSQLLTDTTSPVPLAAPSVPNNQVPMQGLPPSFPPNP